MRSGTKVHRGRSGISKCKPRSEGSGKKERLAHCTDRNRSVAGCQGLGCKRELWGGGNILSGLQGYTTVHVCQSTENCIPRRVNFTVNYISALLQKKKNIYF